MIKFAHIATDRNNTFVAKGSIYWFNADEKLLGIRVIDEKRDVVDGDGNIHTDSTIDPYQVEITEEMKSDKIRP